MGGNVFAVGKILGVVISAYLSSALCADVYGSGITSGILIIRSKVYPQDLVEMWLLVGDKASELNDNVAHFIEVAKFGEKIRYFSFFIARIDNEIICYLFLIERFAKSKKLIELVEWLKATNHYCVSDRVAEITVNKRVVVDKDVFLLGEGAVLTTGAFEGAPRCCDEQRGGLVVDKIFVDKVLDEHYFITPSLDKTFIHLRLSNSLLRIFW